MTQRTATRHVRPDEAFSTPARLSSWPRNHTIPALEAGARSASRQARFRYDAPHLEQRLVEMVVLVLVFVVSALAALSIAAEHPTQQKGGPSDEPAAA